jgi:hypothetical protein
MSASGGERSESPVSERRRSFVATRREQPDENGGRFPDQAKESGEESSPEELPVRADDEDDLPVLTEIVLAEEEEEIAAPVLPDSPAVPPPEAPIPPAIAGDIDPIDIEELTARMVQAIDHRMAYELPTLIEATLLSVSAELRNGIRSTMDDALREFIARQKEAPSGEP